MQRNHSVNQIVQVVPYLPPVISGVGDYACLLAEELRRTHDIHTRFVVGNPDWRGPAEVNGFPVIQAEERTANAFTQLLLQAAGEGMPILLHYVSYGYQKRGCPFWLVRGLEVWRRTGGIKGLITMFHELYARRGAVWTSSFWNSHFQRRLALKLAQMTDVCWTNRNHLRVELEQMAPRHAGRITLLPVFSNFGEPENLLAVAQRKPQAILFGGLGRGVKNIKQTEEMLGEAAGALGIERLVMIGTRTCPQLRLGLEVVNSGVLSASQISAALAASRVGILDYYDGELAKSGVFAAYCAHGMTPMLIRRNASDGLEAGAHFLVACELKRPVSLAGQQKVATRAREWYASHNLSRTASSFVEDVAALVSTQRNVRSFAASLRPRTGVSV